jgi:hypothetical protein
VNPAEIDHLIRVIPTTRSGKRDHLLWASSAGAGHWFYASFDAASASTFRIDSPFIVIL